MALCTLTFPAHVGRVAAKEHDGSRFLSGTDLVFRFQKRVNQVLFRKKEIGTSAHQVFDENPSEKKGIICRLLQLKIGNYGFSSPFPLVFRFQKRVNQVLFTKRKLKNSAHQVFDENPSEKKRIICRLFQLKIRNYGFSKPFPLMLFFKRVTSKMFLSLFYFVIII